jgi:hypothetical protein
MTVNELIKILSKVENKDAKVTLSIDYGWGETMKSVEVDGFFLEKDEDSGIMTDEFRLSGEEESEEDYESEEDSE